MSNNFFKHKKRQSTTIETMSSKPTLFDRLGSVDAVKAAVEELYTRLLADEYTAPLFERVPMARLKVSSSHLSCHILGKFRDSR
jgi:truncated hemoglobin YjbI